MSVHYHFDHLDDAVPGDDCEECEPMTVETTDNDRLDVLRPEVRSLAARIKELGPTAAELRKAYERGVRWGQQPKTLDRKRAEAEAAEALLSETQARKAVVDAELEQIYRRQHDARVDEQQAVVDALLPLVPEGIEARPSVSFDYASIELRTPDRFGPTVTVYGPRPDYDYVPHFALKGWSASKINHSSASSANRIEDARWMVTALTTALALAEAWDAARGIQSEEA